MEYIATLTDSIYFGKYPCDDVLNACIDLQIKTIVDLTHEDDHLFPYTVPQQMKKITFPIEDMSTAKDKPTLDFIKTCMESSKEGPLYIHCLGGHGRSGLISAILYATLYEKSGEEALLAVKEAHAKRKTMHPKMRKLGSPQTKAQKKQVMRLCS